MTSPYKQTEIHDREYMGQPYRQAPRVEQVLPKNTPWSPNLYPGGRHVTATNGHFYSTNIAMPFNHTYG